VDAAGDCALVPIMVHGTPRQAAAVARRAGVRAPVLVDDGHLARRFSLTTVPATLVLDATGHAVEILVGARSREQLARAIARAR